MTLLQLFFVLSGVVLLVLSIDISRKQRFDFLHIFIFIFLSIGLLVFTLFPGVLDFVGNLFGLNRGADILVYSSIIFLVYFNLFLLSKHFENRDSVTGLIRELAIENSQKKIIKGKEVFLIPSYNEGEVLEKTINDIYSNGYKNILVVDDGSTDNTRNILSKYEDINYIKHLKNRGQGAGLETGFEYLRRYGETDFVVTFDADGQHDIHNMNIFYEYINDYPDSEIYIGSRFLGEKPDLPKSRSIILKLGVIFTFVFSGIKLTDTHNGYRVIRSSLLDKISLTIDGMGHASEITDIISRNKIKYTEVPVDIKYTKYSISKGQSSSNAIAIAIRFIWNKFFR